MGHSKQILYELGRCGNVFSQIAPVPVDGKLGEDSWGLHLCGLGSTQGLAWNQSKNGSKMTFVNLPQ